VNHGKLKINLNTIFLMIKILYKKSKNFEKNFEYYLNLRRKYPDTKTNLVKKYSKT